MKNLPHLPGVSETQMQSEEPLVQYFHQECYDRRSVIRQIDLRVMQASYMLCSEYCPCTQEQLDKSLYKNYNLFNAGVQLATRIQDCRYYSISQSFVEFEQLTSFFERNFDCSGVCSKANKYLFTSHDSPDDKPKMSCISALTSKYFEVKEQIG